MKNIARYLVLLFLTFCVGCTDQKKETTSKTEESSLANIPFTTIDLKDMASFKTTTANWEIVKSVYADRTKNNVLTTEKGTGVLVNRSGAETNENLYTGFEHGDIELEFDVLMAKASSVGLFFQSYYELQLTDSWGVAQTDMSSMGGISAIQSDNVKGSAPRTNAAKAPGLWQHFKILFHAPKFDESGVKIKNAWFEKVYLNGTLIQENMELLSPKLGDLETEQTKAPLMIQGDDGAVAFKNIKYKLYENVKIELNDINVRVFDSPSWGLPNLDSLAVPYSRATDSISPITVVDRMGQGIVEYTGSMDIPVEGDYLFDLKVNGSAAFLIEKDTLLNLNGNYPLDSVRLGKIRLKKGRVPFKLLYNKHAAWRRGLEFHVEGPGMQRYSIQKPIRLASNPINASDFTLEVTDTPITQRSFWMHHGSKRTHCIAVGMPQGIHYVYDLEAGSLLQIWGGNFMDATQMWLSRGEKQLGSPMGFIVSLHGDPEFAMLENSKAVWPEKRTGNANYRQLGYKFNAEGIPSFSNRVEETTVINTFIPTTGQRGMQRVLSVDGGNPIWHKIAEGESIEKLPDGSFIINNESYFVDFSKNEGLEPTIRSSEKKEELIVQIPAGKQKIEYSIIW